MRPPRSWPRPAGGRPPRSRRPGRGGGFHRRRLWGHGLARRPPSRDRGRPRPSASGTRWPGALRPVEQLGGRHPCPLAARGTHETARPPRRRSSTALPVTPRAGRSPSRSSPATPPTRPPSSPPPSRAGTLRAERRGDGRRPGDDHLGPYRGAKAIGGLGWMTSLRAPPSLPWPIRRPYRSACSTRPTSPRSPTPTTRASVWSPVATLHLPPSGQQAHRAARCHRSRPGEVRAAVERERPRAGPGQDRLKGGQSRKPPQDGQALQLAITDESFGFSRKDDQISAEAAFDGIYVVRASAPHTIGL